MLFKKWWKKIDKLITGVVIWWALASIFWLSKKLRWEKNKTNKKTFFWILKENTWKVLVGVLNIFNKKK